MKVTNPSQCGADTNNLNKFFMLLYKIDIRNKKHRKDSNNELDKNGVPQVKIAEDEKKV